MYLIPCRGEKFFAPTSGAERREKKLQENLHGIRKKKHYLRTCAGKFIEIFLFPARIALI
jgi:hypothetical protein